MADTGNGGSVTFGTSAITGDWVSIGETEFTREKLETTHLGTTGNYKTYIAADYADTGDTTGTLYFNPANLGTLLAAVVTGTSETITKTYPTSQTLAGSGYVIGVKDAEMVNEDVMQAEVTWAFDGITGPTATT